MDDSGFETFIREREGTSSSLYYHIYRNFRVWVILTFLVFLVTDYGGNALIYGLLASTYPAFQLIGAPILGRWSDLYGRKKILLLSQLGTLIAWVIFLAAIFMPVIPLLKVESSLLGIFTITLPLLALSS